MYIYTYIYIYVYIYVYIIIYKYALQGRCCPRFLAHRTSFESVRPVGCIPIWSTPNGDASPFRNILCLHMYC